MAGSAYATDAQWAVFGERFTDHSAAALARLVTTAETDATPAPADHPLPAVLLMPGYFLPANSLTVLASDLASHGYIVLTIDPPARSELPSMGDAERLARAKARLAAVRDCLRRCRIPRSPSDRPDRRAPRRRRRALLRRPGQLRRQHRRASGRSGHRPGWRPWDPSRGQVGRDPSSARGGRAGWRTRPWHRGRPPWVGPGRDGRTASDGALRLHRSPDDPGGHRIGPGRARPSAPNASGRSAWMARRRPPRSSEASSTAFSRFRQSCRRQRT